MSEGAKSVKITKRVVGATSRTARTSVFDSERIGFGLRVRATGGISCYLALPSLVRAICVTIAKVGKVTATHALDVTT
ncbi:hypothetical protein [Mesorhizobium sp. LNJC403B00]|uniref:hypothetical protein n=1 Tax=Mesorhizobium sp. LNJC403B00 TaxID=1287280 RepID=UPI0012EB9500|nr:hypothetical protein [Mesorhizobium sp. LNJC403B00]